MKQGYINLVDLDFEYKLWKLRIELFNKEMSIIKDRNEEVNAEANIEGLSQVELASIEKHIENVNQIFSSIKVQEQELHFYNKDFPITVNHQFFIEHEVIRERVVDISKKHNDYFAQLMSELTIKKQ